MASSLSTATILADPNNRKYIKEADIRAFIPCGGFKDTVNLGNIRHFLTNFEELEFIVEGANVFFDDSARRHMAVATKIKQLKDTSANKGGVFSSSIAEVLTAFLLGEDYDVKLLNNKATRWGLIKDIMLLVERYARQEKLEANIAQILADTSLVRQLLERYIPAVPVEKLGLDRITSILEAAELQSYRNTILTKKLASMAFYRFGTDWKGFLKKLEKDLPGTLYAILKN